MKILYRTFINTPTIPAKTNPMFHLADTLALLFLITQNSVSHILT